MCSTCGETCECSKQNEKNLKVSSLSDNKQTIFEKMDTSLGQRFNNRFGCSLWIVVIIFLVFGYLAFQIGQSSNAKNTSIGVGGFFIGTIKPDKNGNLPPIMEQKENAQKNQEENLNADAEGEFSSLSTEVAPSLSQFAQLEVGMSFDEVVQILGAPTNVLRQYTSRSIEAGTDFTWYRWGNSQKQITILFKNGMLYVKEQKGIM